MNYVQFLGKLGIYQMKVFISRYIKTKGSYEDMEIITSLRNAGYLYDWQYNILLKRSVLKAYGFVKKGNK